MCDEREKVRSRSECKRDLTLGYMMRLRKLRRKIRAVSSKLLHAEPRAAGAKGGEGFGGHARGGAVLMPCAVRSTMTGLLMPVCCMSNSGNVVHKPARASASLKFVHRKVPKGEYV